MRDIRNDNGVVELDVGPLNGMERARKRFGKGGVVWVKEGVDLVNDGARRNQHVLGETAVKVLETEHVVRDAHVCKELISVCSRADMSKIIERTVVTSFTEAAGFANDIAN